jgi:hypothetical protein
VSGEEAAAADATAPGAKGDSYVGSLEEAVLHNANQFHKWHTELEAACASETEEKYKQYGQLLQSHLASCDRLQDQVCVAVSWGCQLGGCQSTQSVGQDGWLLCCWYERRTRGRLTMFSSSPTNVPPGCCFPSNQACLP